MSFRHDNDAALARADALEAQVVELSRARDRMKEELEAVVSGRARRRERPVDPASVRESERGMLSLSALMAMLFVLRARLGQCTARTTRPSKRRCSACRARRSGAMRARAKWA